MSETAPPSPRVTVRRIPDRGRYDRADVAAVLDATALCHVGVVVDGAPMVVPTLQARVDDHLYLHASTGSRLAMIAARDGGVAVCVTVTLLDGLVLARSAFHHSVNYRSAVVLGDATLVVDRDEKVRALRATTDHVVAGRWDELRPVTDRELAATAVLRVSLDEASVKVRDAGPKDDEVDVDPTVWAGVVPLRTVHDAPVPADDVGADTPLPDSVRRLLDA